MTTDNRTNVQIVADALRSMPEAERDDDRDPAVVVAEYAVAALEAAARAAQGATPQAAKDIHEPNHDRVYCVRCGGNWPCQPAPVPPSSGVGEDDVLTLIYRVREAEARIAEAAKLHQPQPGQGVRYCADCDQRWPCPTAVSLGLNEGESTDD